MKAIEAQKSEDSVRGLLWGAGGALAGLMFLVAALGGSAVLHAAQRDREATQSWVVTEVRDLYEARAKGEDLHHFERAYDLDGVEHGIHIRTKASDLNFIASATSKQSGYTYRYNSILAEYEGHCADLACQFSLLLD